MASRSPATPWHRGPTVLESLDLFTPAPSKSRLPLRMPVQDVYKFDKRRIVAGRVEAGVLRVGDGVCFTPSGHETQVKTIERWNSNERDYAVPGESVGITLAEQLFVERGEIVSCVDDPPKSSNVLVASLFWLGKRHLTIGRPYTLKLATQEVECRVAGISNVIDTASLASMGGSAQEVAKNEVATVTLDLKRPLAFDAFSDVVETGRFVVVDEHDVAGGGIVTQADVPETYEI